VGFGGASGLCVGFGFVGLCLGLCGFAFVGFGFAYVGFGFAVGKAKKAEGSARGTKPKPTKAKPQSPRQSQSPRRQRPKKAQKGPPYTSSPPPPKAHQRPSFYFLLYPMFFEICTVLMCALLAIGVSWTRSPFMALMYSVILFINASFVIMMLGFEFMALVNLLVYVGALAVLFLFVIMLLEIPATELRAYGRGWSTMGIFVLAIMALGPYSSGLSFNGGYGRTVVTGVANAESISTLGHALYLHFADLLILNSLVLTIALFGAFATAPVKSRATR
jgi:NADH:ubiquinone oxidoreductase subunit 6 (subunit J)